MLQIAVAVRRLDRPDSGGKCAYHDERGDDRGQCNAYLRLHFRILPMQVDSSPINRSQLIEAGVWSL